MNGYRKELKYILDDRILTDVRNRISGLMKPDRHQEGDFYKIRSIYFDSPDLKCYHENLSGVSTREKYRVRTYGCSKDSLFAEIKIRHRDTISKMSVKIGCDLFNAIISGEAGVPESMLIKEISSLPDDPPDERSNTGRRVLEKYLMKISSEVYRPKCIVDYERSAYVYDPCNVRITFDRNVFSSTDFNRMFDPSLTGRPSLDDNLHILEIKYDEFLPDEIKSVLGGLRLTRNSISKYVMCTEAQYEF